MYLSTSISNRLLVMPRSSTTGDVILYCYLNHRYVLLYLSFLFCSSQSVSLVAGGRNWRGSVLGQIVFDWSSSRECVKSMTCRLACAANIADLEGGQVTIIFPPAARTNKKATLNLIINNMSTLDNATTHPMSLCHHHFINAPNPDHHAHWRTTPETRDLVWD